MVEGSQELLFVQYRKPGRPPGRRERRQVHRHVQLKAAGSVTKINAIPREPLPVQIVIHQKPLRCRLKTKLLDQNSDCGAGSHEDEQHTPDSMDLRIWIPPSSRTGTEEEMLAMQYYTEFVADSFGGDMSSYFWSNYVLKRHHHEEVIRKALVATGMAHRERNQLASSPSRTTISGLQEAYTTLRTYLAETKAPSHSLVIACAIVLFKLERLLQNNPAAASHLDSAMQMFKIARQRMAQRMHTAEWHGLEVILYRLDTGATIQDMCRQPQLPLLPNSSLDSDRSLHFDNIEAMDDYVLSHLLHPALCLRNQPSTSSKRKAHLRNDLQQWKRAFDNFELRPRASLREELDLLLVKAHFWAVKCILEQDSEDLGGAIAWNSRSPYLAQLRRKAEARGSQEGWNWEEHFSGPLLLLASKSRNGDVRWNGLDLAVAG